MSRKFMVVRTPEQKVKGEGGLTTMAKGQDNGATILLGLEDYKVGEVVGVRKGW